MTKIIPLFFLILFSFKISAQTLVSPVGLWKTIDDKTKSERAVIEISEKDNVLYGTIVKTFPRPGDTGLCDKCVGELSGAKIIGLQILKNLKQEQKSMVWSGGTILDPENGQDYKAYIELIDDGKKLKVKGYIGIPLIGRSQYWIKE